MSTVFDRFGYNFDTSKFGDAAKLSPDAANTLNLIANNTPGYAQWQIDDLKAGSPVRTDYFRNPTNTNTSSILSTTDSVRVTANTIMTANTVDVVGGGYTTGNVFVTTDQIEAATRLYGSAGNLIIEVNAFKKHTDNISGVTTVSSQDYPSYASAAGLGQMSMMTITKTDGAPQDTTPILGSFTSLFIQPELTANDQTLITYNSEFTVNSSATFIQTISDYANSTMTILSDRRNQDVNFFKNSFQVMNDLGFLQQFSNMGGTQTYLVMNLIGTDSLVAKLSANTANT